LSSCGASKSEIVYFQGLNQKGEILNGTELRNINIKSNDQLSITVAAAEQSAAAPFNLTVQGTPSVNVFGGVMFNQNQQVLQSYLVDIDGNIEFPILGTIQVAGLSRQELQALLKIKISEYVQNPIVNVRILNFQISVLGEVRVPGTYEIRDEYLTLTQALGLAGDLTIYAERSNVLVIRQESDKKVYEYLDLRDPAILNSPFYTLQQNDVIYVEPKSNYVNSAYTRNSQVYISVLSALISLSILIFR
jgi:polysaccharide export outer membrane protein